MQFKLNVLKCLNIEIVILCETQNYTVYQHDRQPQGWGTHGSGGVAIAIKNSLLFSHEIVGIYKTFDGILGNKLQNRDTEYSKGIIGNYLSPDNYHYGRDPETYFNNCSVLWDTLSDCDLRVGTGDYNSRTKQQLDYIPDIDGNLVPPRTNIDNFKNSHDESFITFLKDNRAIILNGRVTPQFNNYTFATPRGASVPDYMFCPIDNLNNFEQFKVLLMKDIVNTFNLLPPQNLPDHSFLYGIFGTNQVEKEINSNYQPRLNFQNGPKPPPKKNLKKIDSTFFMNEDIQQQVLNTIEKIEANVGNQTELDMLWGDVKNLFLSEMDKLPILPSSNIKKSKQAI